MNYIEAIRNFEPINEQEENDKRLILNFIEKNADVLYRDNEYAHMTSSGLIFNNKLDKILRNRFRRDRCFRARYNSNRHFTRSPTYQKR